MFIGQIIAAGPATAYWPGDGFCGKVKANGKTFK
jgi:hypothetical protein